MERAIYLLVVAIVVIILLVFLLRLVDGDGDDVRGIVTHATARIGPRSGMG